MKILWKLKKSNVGNIIAEMPDPKPAYNTVSTIIRILEDKKFIGHVKKNRGYIYYPLVTEEIYCSKLVKDLVDNYFNGSVKKMVCFYIRRNKYDTGRIEDLLVKK